MALKCNEGELGINTIHFNKAYKKLLEKRLIFKEVLFNLIELSAAL